MHDIETSLLRTFVTIAEHGGVSAAARRLGKTQAAVSMQLRRLEDDLGVNLLKRASRGMMLTDAGHVLMPYARKILGTSTSARQALSGQAVSGVVRLGMIEDIAIGALPNTLQRFSAAHPQVALDIVIAESPVLSEKLSAGTLDIAIGDPGQMAATPQMTWQLPLRWVASRNFTVGQDEIVPLVSFDSPCVWQQRVAAALGQAARPWRTVCTSTSLSAILAAVQAGLGIAALLEASIDQNTMKVVGAGEGLPAAPLVDFGLFVASGRDPASPAVRAFQRFIAEELQIAENVPQAGSG